MEIEKKYARESDQLFYEGIEHLRLGNYEKAHFAFDRLEGNSEIDALNNRNSYSRVFYNDGVHIFMHEYYKAIANFLLNNKKRSLNLIEEIILKHVSIERIKKNNQSDKLRLTQSNFFELQSDIEDIKGFRLKCDLTEQKSLSYILLDMMSELMVKDFNSQKLDAINEIKEKEVIKISETPLFLIKLNDLVGLKSVKNKVEELRGVVRMRQIRKERNLEVTPQTLHMVFTGNPGTGKTTVARILASDFKEIGLLSKGHLVEIDRASIVEKYVGHTAKKMQELVESAKGGILFIDEAYALARDDNDKDFGKEAIDTLVKLMEDNREDLVVIVAGYPVEMEKFLKSNSGLKSRFTDNINFDDYTLDELLEVFERMCMGKGYQLNENLKIKVKEQIQNAKSKDDNTFGNARGVRKIFEKIEMRQMSRLSKKDEKTIEDEELQTFLEEDILF